VAAVRGVETGAWAVGSRLVWRIGARRSSDVCLTLRTGRLRLGDILGRFGELPASCQLALLPASKRDGGLGAAEQIFLRSPLVRLV